MEACRGVEGKSLAALFKALYHGYLEDVEKVVQDRGIILRDVIFRCECSIFCDCFKFYTGRQEISGEELEAVASTIEKGQCQCLTQEEKNPQLTKVAEIYPMHLAVWRDHVHLIQYLIDSGCDINAKDPSGVTPLYLVVFPPHRLRMLNEVLKHKPDIDAHRNHRDRYPLLLCALEAGNYDYLEPLVKAGCNVNEIDQDGHTLLLRAVYSQSEFLVRKLLRLGADVNISRNTAYGCLVRAVRWRDEDLLRLLVDAGCDVNVMPNDGQERLTALQMTVCQGLSNMTEVLINAGAEVNRSSRDIPAPLSLAAGENHLRDADLLLAAGCDVNQKQESLYAAIHFAAWNGHLEMVEKLLKAGAEYDAPTRDLNTPLALACHGDWPSVIQRLLQLDKNVNNADKDLDTPLHYTTFNGNFDCTLMLLKEGADPGIENRLKATPIWNATYVNNPEIVSLLMKGNVDVNVPSLGIDQAAQSDLPVTIYTVPRTPIQVAILKGYTKVAELLSIQLSLQEIMSQMSYLSIHGDLMEHGEDTEIMRWYRQVTSRPKPLLCICRRTIRKLLAKHVFASVCELDIPKVLQRYLVLADIPTKAAYPYTGS